MLFVLTWTYYRVAITEWVSYVTLPRIKIIAVHKERWKVISTIYGIDRLYIPDLYTRGDNPLPLSYYVTVQKRLQTSKPRGGEGERFW